MESKRRGLFTKSKLVKSLYNRATKPSSTALQPYNCKRNKLTSAEPTDNIIQMINKPKDSSFSTTDGGKPMGFVIVNQDQIYSQQKPPQVAFLVSDRAGKLENFHGLDAEDEAVDAKAARYISNVQERFRLECVKFEEMQLI